MNPSEQTQEPMQTNLGDGDDPRQAAAGESQDIAQPVENNEPAQTAEYESARSGLTQWDIWAGIVPLVALLPMLFIQSQGLWSRTHMQFFPLAVVGAAYFAFWGWKGGESTHPVRRWMAIGILLLATVAYLVGVWQFSPWLCQLSAIMVFFAWALGRCGNTRWPSIAAWTGVLLTTLPLPLNKDIEFIQWLQRSSAGACSQALDALAIPHLRLANVIQIKNHQLFVEEACSGIGSFYALLAVAVLLLILNRRSFLVSILSLLSVPLWTMTGNTIRLLAIAIAQEAYGRDLSHGTSHELLGLGTFLIAALCFWLTEIFLARMLEPVPIADAEFGLVFTGLNTLMTWPLEDPTEDIPPDDEDELRVYQRVQAVREARQTRYLPLTWTDKPWLFRGVVACGVLMLAAGIAPLAVLARGGAASVSFGLPTIGVNMLDVFPGEEALPEEVGVLKRLGYFRERRSVASNFGQNSLIWKYAWKDQQLALSLDFPFDNWHALSVCYRNAGWIIEKQKTFNGETGKDPWPWEEMEMVNELGGKGYVFFCAFTEDMQPLLDIPGSSVSERLTRSGIVGALTGQPKKAVQTTYQIQIYFEAGLELEASEKKVLRDQFLELRQLALAAAEPGVSLVE